MNYNFTLFIKIVFFLIFLNLLYYTIVKILFKIYFYFEKKLKYDNVYLFCYGSNSINQIKERLNIVSDIEYYPSHINNYSRIFCGFSKKWNGGVASIHPSLFNKVYGITVKLNEKQLEILDNFEKGYSKNIIKVYFENDKKYHDTYVYIKNNIIFNALPSLKYLDSINEMLNDRNPKSSNRKIMIKIYKNENILTLGNWTKEDGIEFINKSK